MCERAHVRTVWHVAQAAGGAPYGDAWEESLNQDLTAEWAGLRDLVSRAKIGWERARGTEKWPHRQGTRKMSCRAS